MSRVLFNFIWHGDVYECVSCSVRPNENYVISKSGRKFDFNDIQLVDENDTMLVPREVKFNTIIND